MTRRPALSAFALLATLWLAPAPLAARAVDEPHGPEMPLRFQELPPRPGDAPGGAEFARRASQLTERGRQHAAMAELRRGNAPEFLRDLRPVELSHRRSDGSQLSGTVWVTPDYLAIGSDDDFLRMPLSLPDALTICDEYGFVLPTRKIVDAIYEQASFHLSPKPMQPGPQMRSTDYLWRHQQLIETQLAGHPHGELVAGHKKDLVLTGRLNSKPGRVAIYGWHRLSGQPIQPLSTVHGENYLDYSHGVRLVSGTMLVDGVRRRILEVLEDPLLAPLLSYESVIGNARTLMRP
jgi:hypothetical protein